MRVVLKCKDFINEIKQFRRHLKCFLLLLIFCISCNGIFAQTSSPPDSMRFYKKMEDYSKRNKFNKFLYRLAFKPIPVPATAKPKKNKRKKNVIDKTLSAFEGKIIRNINIETYDPIGKSISDTINPSSNFLIKAGNKLHIKSQNGTIRNLLLIHQNQPFDSLKVKESERLIRSQSYVHDVVFLYVLTSKNSDSVDIFIRELDNWSITLNVAASTNRSKGNLADKNFMGFGHEFKNSFTWYQTTGKYAYNASYLIPNIRNTHVTATVQYSIDEYKYYTRNFAIDRPFFSPLAKWAGGINYTNRFQKDSLLLSDSVYVNRRFNFSTQDYWVARSWQLFKGNSVNKRTTNLILSERLIRVYYHEKPIEQYDSTNSFSNEIFYLSGLSISQQKYIQDKYIFSYGITEDVPVGFVYGITGGYNIKNNTGRLFGAIRASFGNHHDWGYMSADFEYSTFIHVSRAEQGIFTTGVNYFTNLFEIGKWKFRQFVKPQLTIGINRLPFEIISINDENGIRGFSTPVNAWTRKLALTLQTQSYAPWKFLGFRFGPYLISSFELFGDDDSGFHRSKLYSRFALGVLIKNEYLVFNVLQVSIVFYPVIPGNGTNIFKFNSGSTKDFGFRDFVVGKPSTILFQ